MLLGGLIYTMELTTAALMLQNGLPALSEMMNPEAMLLTSLAVGLLGLAVMLLGRPREAELVPETAPEGERAGIPEQPPAEQDETFRTSVAAAEEPAAATLPTAASSVIEAPGATMAPAECAVIAREVAAANEAIAEPAVVQIEGERLPVAPLAGAGARGPAMGASALIAKVATLLPAGTAAAGAGSSKPKQSRGSVGFQPAGRFLRSQQAYLRIPVMLKGLNEAGCEFQEDSTTVILLPQGAVIPMRRRVQAGDRMTLIIPSRQKEVECEVVGAAPGPDDKVLVEIEFPEPQKSMWPVSFPAWSGKNAKPAANQPTQANAEHALDRSSS